MEKFTNWRDPGTGISPFMPNKQVNKGNLSVRFLRLLINVSVFIFKLPFFLSLIFVFHLIPVRTFRKGVIETISRYLFSAPNFNSRDELIDIRVENVKRLDKENVTANLPRARDVVIVNSSSPLDYLVLYLITNASSFKILTFNGKHKYVDISSFSKFAKYALNVPVGEYPTIANLKSFSKFAANSGPIFIFPEATPSNNNAILKFNNDDSLIDIPEDEKIILKVLSIKLFPAYLTTPVPEGNISYLYRLLTSNNSLKFKVYIAPLLSIRKWSDIRSKISDISGLKLVANDLESKRLFIESFR